jgi:hypothetical protein
MKKSYRMFVKIVSEVNQYSTYNLPISLPFERQLAMAKKRKATSHRSNEPKAFDPKDGKLGPIRTYEDVADSEDEFHIQRDEVLLEDGPEAKKRRKWEDDGRRPLHTRVESVLRKLQMHY